jgi:AAA domain
MGKTTNAIVEILEMVRGHALPRQIRFRFKGQKNFGAKPLRVWYVNGEDPRNEIELRFQAAMQHYGITQEDIDGRLFIDSGREHDFVVARDEARKFAYATPVVGNVVSAIKANSIDCLVVDPVIAFHRVPENDNSKIEVVASAFRQIAKEGDNDSAGVAVELIADTKKVGDREVSVEDVRGAYSLIGAARSVRVANFMTKEEGAAAALAPGDFASFFRVDNVKANMTARAPASKWRRLVSVKVPVVDEDDQPTVENVATCEPWFWPSAEEAEEAERERLTPETMDAILDAVSKAHRSGKNRADRQSPAWVGYAVIEALDLDPTDKKSKDQVAAWLKLLVGSEDLEKYKAEGKDRHPAMFIGLSKKTLKRLLASEK